MTASVAPSRGGSSSGGNIIPKGYKQGRIQQFTPEQQNLFQQMFQNVDPNSFLGRLAGGDQSMFEQMEQPAMRQFASLQGGLATRFGRGSGQGSLGNFKSSGFQNAQNQATSDFASQLQSNRVGLQKDALKQLMEMSQMLLNQRPQDNFYYRDAPKEKKTSFLSKILGGLGPLAGAGYGRVKR